MSTSTLAQEASRIDSLQAELDWSSASPRQVSLLNLLAQLHLDIDTDISLSYAKQALALAEHLSYFPGQVEALLTIGEVYCRQADRAAALDWVTQAWQIAQDIGYTTGTQRAARITEACGPSVPVSSSRPVSYKPRYFQLGVGYTLPKFLDESSSALRYQGHAGSVTSRLHWARPDTTAHHIGSIRFDYGRMAAFAFEFADVNFFRLEGDYRYEKQIGRTSKNRVRWYIGGSFNGLWTLWNFENYSNNAFNNSFYFSLSPHTTLAYPFRLGRRKFQLSYAAFLPLLTFAVRPSYGTTRFPEFLDDERDEPVQQFFGSGQLTTLNNFFRFSNTIALDYVLPNANRLRLGYTWNYVHYNEPRMVQSASHNITLSTMFNF